ncbi:MAG: hypothetical protein P1S46_06280 [bacterium]|nr:hypothetical protein [bacterium]
MAKWGQVKWGEAKWGEAIFRSLEPLATLLTENGITVKLSEVDYVVDIPEE